jgi:PKD repeat protein
MLVNMYRKEEAIMNNYFTSTSLRELFPCFGSAGLALFLCSGPVFAANVNLAWDASRSANVGGYIVSYGEASGKYTSNIDVGNKTMFTVCGLEEGARYYFTVKAYDAGRKTESDYASEVSKTVPAATSLAADFIVSTTSGDPELVVNFTPLNSGAATSWKWDFPGSNTPTVTNSTARDATATYSSPGTYSVSLTVTGPNESVTKTKANLINVKATGGTTKGINRRHD